MWFLLVLALARGSVELPLSSLVFELRFVPRPEHLLLGGWLVGDIIVVLFLSLCCAPLLLDNLVELKERGLSVVTSRVPFTFDALASCFTSDSSSWHSNLF